jgi:hypothetical protein
MLPRQPLRFLLADDPGAGKTIMAGLFIKELLIRGDLQRCLVVSPGNLVGDVAPGSSGRLSPAAAVRRTWPAFMKRRAGAWREGQRGGGGRRATGLAWPMGSASENFNPKGTWQPASMWQWQCRRCAVVRSLDRSGEF